LAEDADIPAVAPPVIPHTWTGGQEARRRKPHIPNQLINDRQEWPEFKYPLNNCTVLYIL
jgi:hypothetical protein